MALPDASDLKAEALVTGVELLGKFAFTNAELFNQTMSQGVENNARTTQKTCLAKLRTQEEDMSVNHVERAFRAWPILTKRARNRDNITYGELAGLLGVHHRPIRYVLGVIQDYCIEANLPPLTILVINQSGMPGSGFIAYDFDNLEQGREWVWDFSWDSIENPFDFAADGESYETLVNKLVNDPDNSGDVYRKVKARGVKQVIFRDALLKAYGRKCGFTGISFYETLEAAHIVPWSQCDASERMDVRNGILLNSLHHKLFDSSYLTVNDDYRIIYSDPKAIDGIYSDFDRIISSELHGKRMFLPFKVKNRPSLKYLKRHHGIHEWEMMSLRCES